jgi:hypothetical protein
MRTEKSPVQQAKFMESVLTQLQKLDLLLADAQQRVKAPAHRASNHQIVFALRELDMFLTFINRRLTADSTSIAYPILYFADPKLTPRVVEPALKDFVKVRSNWDWTGVWVEHYFRG